MGVEMQKNASLAIIVASGVAIGALLASMPARAAVAAGQLACSIGSGPGFITGRRARLAAPLPGPRVPSITSAASPSSVSISVI